MEDPKEQLPEFIVKLCDILKKKQYEPFICWTSDGTEVLIKSPKKVEDKVLPHYFRHRRLSSFIRQMNMYGFTKVNKLVKEKAYLYFKNDDFIEGDMQGMKRIRRKKNRGHEEQSEPEASKTQKRGSRTEGNQYEKQKLEIVMAFSQVQQILGLVAKEHPEVERELTTAIDVCRSMTHQNTGNTPVFKPQAPSFQEVELFNCPSLNSVSQFLNENEAHKEAGNPLNILSFPSLGSFGNL